MDTIQGGRVSIVVLFPPRKVITLTLSDPATNTTDLAVQQQYPNGQSLAKKTAKKAKKVKKTAAAPKMAPKAAAKPAPKAAKKTAPKAANKTAPKAAKKTAPKAASTMAPAKKK